jgi:hypothetical protein
MNIQIAVQDTSSYTSPSYYNHPQRMMGFSPVSSYTDSLTLLQTSYYVTNKNYLLYIYDGYSPTISSIPQPFKSLAITIKSTRPRTAPLATISKYTDSMVPTINTPGTPVRLIQIVTNSSYRG